MIDDVDNIKIIVSKKVSFGKTGFENFIAYKGDEKVKPYIVSNIMRNSIKKGFDSESVYNQKYLKTKMKS